MKRANMNKTAIDSSAKSYWKLLYGTYGEQLTRDIPRRIKAALVANKKVASVDESANINPVAIVQSGGISYVEGTYTGTPSFLFCAKLDSSGNVQSIESKELP